jgi:hypothetical protein
MTDRQLMQRASAWAERWGQAVFAGGGMAAVDEMNAWHKAIRERLAQPEPVSDAGIKIWIGNKQVVQHLTQTQLHYARDPWMLFEMTVGKCIAALKEKNND